ncbi:MAG TPA: choice-of-anchor D domain-containing protein, partial [Bacteroidetes bacterium]|nr:choice-of-anchor D domain-containing protein [Bacteroidota bacterium]
FIADTFGGLRVVDVSEPDEPVEIGSLDTEGETIDVYMSGGLLFLADGLNGFLIIDTSDPENPVEVDSFDTDGYAGGVRVLGDLAYVADGTDGLLILDISDYTNPQIALSTDTLDFGEVNRGLSSEMILTITNEGGVDLTVAGVTVEGDCFSVDINREIVLERDDSLDLTVAFAPERVGRYQGSLAIDSNDPDDRQVRIVLSGVGIEASGIRPEQAGIVDHSILKCNPNPFNAGVCITIQLPRSVPVTLSVYGFNGREVALLAERNFSAGVYSFNWTADDQSSGIYLVCLKAAGRFWTEKLVLAR